MLGIVANFENLVYANLNYSNIKANIKLTYNTSNSTFAIHMNFNVFMREIQTEFQNEMLRIENQVIPTQDSNPAS